MRMVRSCCSRSVGRCNRHHNTAKKNRIDLANAGNPDAMDQLKTLLNERTAQYERASVMVDTASKPIQSSVNELLAAIAKNRFLDSSGME